MTDDPETELRRLWTQQGIPTEQQNRMVEQIKTKAQPGQHVGPFIIKATPSG